MIYEIWILLPHEVLKYAAWQRMSEKAHCVPEQPAAAPLSKTWLNKVTEIWSSHCMYVFYEKHRYSPTVSPLLSSGFAPGLFSWSTVCALDEEHPMFGKKWAEMNQKLGIRASKRESRGFLFSKTGTVWQWKHGQLNSLQFLRVAEHHYLPLSVCVFMHGLLPSCPRQRCVMSMQLGSAGSTAECSLTASCSQSHYSYRRRQHVHEMCVCVCVLASIGVSLLD